MMPISRNLKEENERSAPREATSLTWNHVNPRLVHIDDNEIALTEVKCILKQIKDLNYVGGFTDPVLASKFIRDQMPDIVVLDTTISGQSGIDFALSFQDLPISVVFLAAYDDLALEAYKAAPLGFLLKPSSLQELEEIIALWRRKHPYGALERTTRILDRIISERASFHHHPELQKKLFISTINSIQIIDLSELILIEAQSNYSTFHLEQSKSITSSKNLKIYADVLAGHPDFIRISRTFVVNKHFVKEIRRPQRGKTSIVMDNGRELNISNLQREIVLNRIKS
jgi:two-component system LytT family response regulator